MAHASGIPESEGNLNTVRLTVETADLEPGQSVARVWYRSRLEWLRSGRLLAATGITGLVIVVLQQLSFAQPASASVGAAICALAAAFALVNPGRTRLVILNLFTIAFVLRLAALGVFYLAAVREGGPFLGPDGAGYLARATDLARRDFVIDSVPPAFFGTYNLAAYYLFAAPLWVLNADLVTLLTLNAGLSALAAAVTYAIGRETVPRAARLLGLCVAVYPSLIVLSVVDLLKDPSIMCAMVVAVWAILRLTRARTLSSLLAPACVGTIALLYLRTGRFYALAYIELALIGTVFWSLVTRRVAVFRLRAAALVSLLMFIVCEAVPGFWRWPPTPLLFADQVAHVLGFPGFWFDTRESFGRETLDDPTSFLGIALSLFRRVFGPYPWIAPDDWTFRALHAGDYLLYPGMLVWYAMLPLVAVGISGVGRTLARGTECAASLAFVFLFTALYVCQYLAINLSYRQREVIFPLLAMFAVIAFPSVMRRRGSIGWYSAYWVCLFVLAGAHLLVRRLLLS